MTPLAPFGEFLPHAIRHPKVRMALRVLAGLCCLDLLVAAFFFCPAAWRHHQLAGGIAAYRNSQREAAEARQRALQYGELLQRVSVLEEKWKAPAAQSALISAVNRFASRNGLRVVSQDFESEKTKTGVESLNQEISLQGSYRALRGFLADLEDLGTLTVVEQTRLERAGQGGNSLRAVLKLRTFSPGGSRAPGRGT